MGNVPPEDVANYLEQAQTSLKRNQVIDRDNGKVDLRYNPLSVDEDYFLPVRGGESGRAIEPGKPGASLLLKRVTARGDEQMPPKTRLKDSEIAALRQWVVDGAVWPVATGAESSRGDDADGVDEVIAPNAPELAKSLKLWLRADTLQVADGGEVIAWPDSSGRGHDLTITRGVRKAGTGTAPQLVKKSKVNGGPAVRFTHGNGLAASPDRSLGLTGDADFTVVLVGQYVHDTSRTYESILMVGNPGPARNPEKPLSILIELETGPKQLDLAGGFSHDASMGPGSAQVLYDQPNILIITRKKGPWTPGARFWLNGESSQQVWGRDPVGTSVVPDVQMRPEHGVAHVHLARRGGALGACRVEQLPALDHLHAGRR